ncbi:transmembrane protein 180-like [Mytilus edulis]|uniref:transmembrane protein 180-like n=1 Tax=Mytilus edulis TaxID=6550 RepID=UPI0039EF4632
MTVNKHRLIAYCASGIAFRMVSTAYSFYYVKVFMNLYHIEAYWFQMAQLVYLTWNVINDPLFGYILDSKRLRITKTRRESILYCGPILVTTFIIPWLPWGDNSWVVGLHLIVSLVSWDTVCTFMSLTMSALFVELSDKTEDRILLTKYYHTACILGTPTVLLLEFTSDSLSNFKTFQLTTLLIAVCSGLLFLYAGINISSPYDPNTIKRTNSDIHVDQGNEISENISEGNESYCTQVCQYLSDANFIAFAVTFFFHVFHKYFVNNFIAIVCDHLIPDDVFPKDARKIFYGGIPLISAICVVFGASFATRYSYYKVVQSVYGSMVLAGFIMLYIGQEHTWCLIIFLMLDSCAISVVYAFFGMAQADLADINKTKYKRGRPLSSMVFGTSSLIARPAISLSPMFVAAILDIYGYSQLKGTDSSLELKHAMFMLVCCYPIIIGSIQFVSWSFFKIPCKSENTILIET